MAELLTEKNQKIYYVPHEVMMELERSWYENEGLRTLLAQFASDSPFKPDNEKFEILINKYIKSYMEYNIIFSTLASVYVSAEDSSKNMTASFELSAFLVDRY
jgi:hypothetical protein